MVRRTGVGGAWAVTLVCGVMLALVGPAGAKDKVENLAVAKKVVTRLPTYYAQVVDKAQRERILAILTEYNFKIDVLELERDQKVAAVLTPLQRKKLEDIKAAAEAKRENKKAAGKVQAVEPAPAAKKNPAQK